MFTCRARSSPPPVCISPDWGAGNRPWATLNQGHAWWWGSLCASVRACERAWGRRVSACAEVRKGHCPLSLSTCSFEAGSFLKLGTHVFSASPSNSLVSAFLKAGVAGMQWMAALSSGTAWVLLQPHIL